MSELAARASTALVPQGPYVVYFRAGGGDDNASPRRTRTENWVVKAVATDQQKARSLDALIDAQLHEAEVTITGWDNYQTARRTDVAYAEPGEGGVVYWHRGGTYRVNPRRVRAIGNGEGKQNLWARPVRTFGTTASIPILPR